MHSKQRSSFDTLIPQLKLCSYLHGILTHFFVPLTLPLSQSSHLELDSSSVSTKVSIKSTKDSACKVFSFKTSPICLPVSQRYKPCMCHRGREKIRPGTEQFPGSPRDEFSLFPSSAPVQELPC